MKLKNVAIIGLVLVGVVGAVISFMVFAAIINGSDSDDQLCGTGGNDVFRGFAGDDVMNNTNPEPPFPACPTVTFGGNDRFWGGEDDDIIFGDAGRDYIDGGPGEDILSAAGGQDRIFGGDGPDTIDGGPDADRLEGGPGDDKFINGAGNDWIRGGAGNDAVEEATGVSSEHDTIYGDGGDDYLEGGDGNDKIFGGNGDDYIDGGAGSDYIDGGPGLDTIFGNFTADSVDETDTYVLRVGDVPDGAIENIYCTMESGDTGLVVLMRGPTGVWPRDGTIPTGTLPQNTTVVIVDPSGPGPGLSGEYHIHTGPGTCRILRR